MRPAPRRSGPWPSPWPAHRPRDRLSAHRPPVPVPVGGRLAAAGPVARGRGGARALLRRHPRRGVGRVPPARGHHGPRRRGRGPAGGLGGGAGPSTARGARARGPDADRWAALVPGVPGRGSPAPGPRGEGPRRSLGRLAAGSRPRVAGGTGAAEGNASRRQGDRLVRPEGRPDRLGSGPRGAPLGPAAPPGPPLPRRRPRAEGLIAGPCRLFAIPVRTLTDSLEGR